MQSTRQPKYIFDLTGGNFALNLANTVSHREDPVRRREHLESYADLVALAQQSGIVSPKQANELLGYAQRHASEAQQVFRKAIVLREALYRLFAAIAEGKAAPSGDLELINDSVLGALKHRRLSRSKGGYRWEWHSNGEEALERILWPMVTSAADLLTSQELHALRWCEAPDCEWLFLDKSRNRSRRWCDMTTCGNRQKARRHYRRIQVSRSRS